MKCLRLSLAAGVLTIALAISALAGEMPCPGIAQPAPLSAGDILIPGVVFNDAVTATALGLVQSVLSLF